MGPESRDGTQIESGTRIERVGPESREWDSNRESGTRIKRVGLESRGPQFEPCLGKTHLLPIVQGSTHLPDIP